MNFWEDFGFFKNSVVSMSGYCTQLDHSKPIYRARKKDFENITDKKELTYLQKEDCIKLRRANIPYHPVFYGSFDPACAVAEITDNNEAVILTEWQWKERAKVRTKLFAKIEHSGSLKRFNIQTLEEYIDAIDKLKGPIEKNYMIKEMLNNSAHLSELFLIKDDYFASAILGYEELYRTRLSIVENTDAIIYPSIVSKHDVNIAIHPEIVDEYLELKKIWELNSSDLEDLKLIWES
jgi:hypothetical protein